MKATGTLRIRSPDHSTVLDEVPTEDNGAVNLVVSGAEAEDDGTLDNGSSGISTTKFASERDRSVSTTSNGSDQYVSCETKEQSDRKEAEERKIRSVTWKTYSSYFRSIGGGYTFCSRVISGIWTSSSVFHIVYVRSGGKVGCTISCRSDASIRNDIFSEMDLNQLRFFSAPWQVNISCCPVAQCLVFRQLLNGSQNAPKYAQNCDPGTNEL